MIGPNVCQENIPNTTTPPPQTWTVERQVVLMDSCFLCQILTLQSVTTETEIHQSKTLTSRFGDPAPSVVSDSITVCSGDGSGSFTINSRHIGYSSGVLWYHCRGVSAGPGKLQWASAATHLAPQGYKAGLVSYCHLWTTQKLMTRLRQACGFLLGRYCSWSCALLSAPRACGRTCWMTLMTKTRHQLWQNFHYTCCRLDVEVFVHCCDTWMACNGQRQHSSVSLHSPEHHCSAQCKICSRKYSAISVHHRSCTMIKDAIRVHHGRDVLLLGNQKCTPPQHSQRIGLVECFN